MLATNLRYLLLTLLAIAPLTATTATFVERSTAQNATTAKAREAINIVSKILKAPTSELQVTSEAKVDSNLTKIKVLHTKTGRLSGISLGSNNNQVSVQQAQAILTNKKGLDFRGKLEKALADRVSGNDATGSSSVVIWTRSAASAPRIDRAVTASDQVKGQVATFRNFHKNSSEPLKQFLKARGIQIKYQSDNAPVLVVSVPNRLLSAIEQRADVQSIQLERTYKSDMDVAAQAVGAKPTVWSRGIIGTGIKVAVVEDDGIYYAHSALADGTYCKPESPNIGNHATAVAGTIGSTDATNRGIAYGGAAVLSGNTGSYTDSEIIKCTDWAMNNGARIINYSFSVNSSGSLVALDRYVDYVVRNRAVTVMKSAGNQNSTCFGPNYNATSPGIGWNMLSVGSYDDKNTATHSDDAMSSFSCYGNPTSPHNDREKPDLTAPGSNITTTCSSSSTCFSSTSGTSFSTPITAGCAALLMQRNSTLQYWPESIRAVLMATSVVNLEGSTRLSDKDGAGGIACDYADDVLQGVNGFETHGSFTKTDFPKTYTFSVTSGQTVRVAIAWNSSTDSASPPTTDELKADLDLIVTSPSGKTVAYSTSWDNSSEIVDFKATETGNYTVKVDAYRFDGSFEYLGIAAWKGTPKKI